MTYLARCVVALAALSALGSRRRPWGAPIAVAVWSPLVGAAMAAAISVFRLRSRLRTRRLADAKAMAELALLGELVGIGLTSGMALAEALAFAGSRLTSQLAYEVEAVRREMFRTGAVGVVAQSAGMAGRLYLLIGRAMATGAPVLPAVESFVAERRADERAQRETALRRLPVLVLFPLALLILPGFVLLIVAPALSGAVERFGL